MPKRFVDTELWDKEWFMNLPPRLKCLVKMVRDKCDLSGVWSPNWVIANTYVGEPVNESELLKIDSGKQFMKITETKIFCLGFIEFQYGNLSENSPVHRKIMNLLDTHKIDYKHPINRVKEKEEDKEEDKEKEKEKKLEPEILKSDYEIIEHPIIEQAKKEFPKLLKMKFPLLSDQVEKLEKEFGNEVLIEVMGAMQNKPDLIKKYESANLTIRSWIKIHQSKNGNNKLHSKNTTAKSTGFDNDKAEEFANTRSFPGSE